MHTFPFLCSLLLCNGVTVAAQKKIQKLLDEEEESLAQIRTPQTLSRGWGDDIEWAQTYEEGLARSKTSKKPLMVIHHLEECPYSQGGLLPKSMSDHSLLLDNLLGYREQSEVCQGSLAPPRVMKLLKAFASSPEVQQMAQEDFIMLNLVHSSSDDNMAPDGHYVPRILFVDPSMTVRADLTGKYGNRMYAYEPEDISTLIENMRQAKLLLRTEL